MKGWWRSFVVVFLVVVVSTLWILYSREGNPSLFELAGGELGGCSCDRDYGEDYDFHRVKSEQENPTEGKREEGRVRSISGEQRPPRKLLPILTGQDKGFWVPVQVPNDTRLIYEWRLMPPEEVTGDNFSIVSSNLTESPQYKLHRFTPREARRCLRRRPLVFIGDSVVRYQYSWLVMFLEKEEPIYPLPRGRLAPSPVIEWDWNTWTDYYVGLAKVTEPYELCANYRPANGDFTLSTDNRFLLDHQMGDNDQESIPGKLILSYFQFYRSDFGMHGHFCFPPFDITNCTRCSPGYCAPPFDWAYSSPWETLAHVVRELNFSHLVFNTGIWAQLKTSWLNSSIEALLLSGMHAARYKTNGQKVWWMTTTNTRGGCHTCPTGGGLVDEPLLIRAKGFGWDVFDRGAMSYPLPALSPPPFHDGTHYWPYVYGEINNYLLNVVCEDEDLDGYQEEVGRPQQSVPLHS